MLFRHALFRDRPDAAHVLAQELQDYRGQHPLILAIPRGAVPMGEAIAHALHGTLDVVLVHKLGVPFNPEFAMGAIAEDGHAWLSDVALDYGIDPEDIAHEKAAQMETLRRRRARYTPARSPVDPAGRLVIIVDDGLATGATMVAALHAVRSRHPSSLICAVPVAARDSMEKVEQLADKVVCPHVRDDFAAVGQFYDVFEQVDDDDVVRILERAQTDEDVSDDSPRPHAGMAEITPPPQGGKDAKPAPPAR